MMTEQKNWFLNSKQSKSYKNIKQLLKICTISSFPGWFWNSIVDIGREGVWYYTIKNKNYRIEKAYWQKNGKQVSKKILLTFHITII